MSRKRNISSLILEHKTMFIIVAVALFMIELQILSVAVLKSGQKPLLQVIDDKGNVIHETNGRHLSDFDRYFFEKIFGPLDQYEVRHITKEIPFPFRAWFVTAVGVPIGVVLLLAFIIKAWAALFYGEEQTEPKPEVNKTEPKTRFESILSKISGLNIFVIGLLAFLAVFLYWVLPNLITYIGRLGIETLTRYKWVFLGATLMLFGLIVWIIYLKYLLAKKTIDSQTEIDKHRLQLEYSEVKRNSLQLEYDENKKKDTPLVDWDNNDSASRKNKKNNADCNYP
ncbi:MAG: hypothetical protein JW786_10585 [Desulfobacterales bacterium]|nr:hypothetical protein [Desulfobacterales bacterium]